jgi:hypothetical protein
LHDVVKSISFPDAAKALPGHDVVQAGTCRTARTSVTTSIGDDMVFPTQQNSNDKPHQRHTQTIPSSRPQKPLILPEKQGTPDRRHAGDVQCLEHHSGSTIFKNVLPISS